MIACMNKNHGWKVLIYLVGCIIFSIVGIVLLNIMIPVQATKLIFLVVIVFLSTWFAVLVCFFRSGIHFGWLLWALWHPKESESEFTLCTIPSGECMDSMFARWKAEPEDYVDVFAEFFVDKWKHVINFYYQMRVGIKNLWIWRKVIWKDRHWDECFIYHILLKKLERIEEYRKTGRYWPAVGDTAINKDIHTMILIIRRILKADYVGISTFQWGLLSKFPRMGPFSFPHKHEEYLEKQDKDLLFKLLSRRIRKLWD